MNTTAIVKIIGSQIACEQGYQDAWREAAMWAAGQLEQSFGQAVQVTYFDLFDQACPVLPADAQLPVILINDEVIINGGKINMPLIRSKLHELGIKEV